MRRLLSIFFIFATALIAGCGQIDEGNVGVRTQLGGKIVQEPLHQGMYQSVLSNVDEYTTKETSVILENMKPRANDNLYLKELDATIYYKTNGALIPVFVSEKSRMSARLEGDTAIRPAYNLIKDLANATFMDEVSKCDSLTIHQNREPLEQAIKRRLQADLNESAPDLITVTRVVIRSVETDPSIEESIRKNVQASKDLDTARKQTAIKEEQARGNIKTSAGLTPELLQFEYIQTLKNCAASTGCTLIIDGSESGKMLNIGGRG